MDFKEKVKIYTGKEINKNPSVSETNKKSPTSELKPCPHCNNKLEESVHSDPLFIKMIKREVPLNPPKNIIIIN
jgi:hypothetical protein